jgi:hypothetical protein
MEQTQIYLTNKAHRIIAAIAERMGWIQSELIRKDADWIHRPVRRGKAARATPWLVACRKTTTTCLTSERCDGNSTSVAKQS